MRQVILLIFDCLWNVSSSLDLTCLALPSLLMWCIVLPCVLLCCVALLSSCVVLSRFVLFCFVSPCLVLHSLSSLFLPVLFCIMYSFLAPPLSLLAQKQPAITLWYVNPFEKCPEKTCYSVTMPPPSSPTRYSPTRYLMSCEPSQNYAWGSFHVDKHNHLTFSIVS